MIKAKHLVYFFTFFLISLPAAGSDQLRQRIEAWSAGYPPSLFGVTLLNDTTLQSFYEVNQYQPVWFENNRLSQQGLLLIQSIEAIGNEGLLPSDYHFSVLKPLLQNTSTPNYALYDLVLSDAFLTLTNHLKAGKIDPESLTSEWKANRRQNNLVELLAYAAGGADIAEILNKVRPNQIRYFRLKDALARMHQLADSDWPPLAQTPAIKPGAMDSRLEAIAHRLAIWGDLGDYDPTGIYDENLEKAVKRFQRRHGLKTDGIIGKDTLQALNISPRQRSEQIMLNMERWRWLAEDLGKKFLVVNIAAFELKIIENNETIFQRPVVVGRNYRKTPVFSDKIRYLVFNPTWTVPPKLAVQDKLPEIQRDKHYLRRYGFTVYKAGTSVVVDPDSVDWPGVPKKPFPFRLVQAPGPLNALGQIKFMFPNSYDVYLHDTPSRELFKKPERAFSSGCVRVADPLDLAEELLRGQQWARNRIDSAIASGVTETVFLKTPMPIHIEYWTAWVERDGTLHFRNDIYKRDKPLWNALNTPLTSLEQSGNEIDETAY